MSELERLSKHILELQKDKGELTDKVKELAEELKLTNNECKDMREELKQRIRENQKLCEQIEKLIDFVLSKTECCDVCPITDTCINSEGTCPYAGILAKGEEEVTREWLMQFISRR